MQDNIPSLRRNPFSSQDNNHQVERALAGANTFDCRVLEVINAELNKITKDLAEIKEAEISETRILSFKTPTDLPQNPSYALAAFMHAPKTNPTGSTDPKIFRPVLHKRKPPPPPTTLTSRNTITLAQTGKEGQVLTTVNYPTLIALVNTKHVEAKFKEQPGNQKCIQVRSVHCHPSNNIAIYTTASQ